MTPRLTDHARARCLSFGLSTKQAKRIVQHADVTYPARDDRLILASDRVPGWSVVVSPDRTTVITVVPRVADAWRHTDTGWELAS